MNADPPKCDEWTMSQEREFMENLFCTRFNFFLVFFSVIVAGAFATTDPVRFRLILALGAALTIPLGLTIARAQTKLNLIIAEIFRNDPLHPAKTINDAANDEIKSGGISWSMRNWIGYWIPLCCWIALTVGMVAAFLGSI